ncbi:MAG: PD40 domain-containing protein [Elusimicrobia bacterium]|nr:PD40 domain-containing protein [Elusimicrobiota bacterium]
MIRKIQAVFLSIFVLQTAPGLSVREVWAQRKVARAKVSIPASGVPLISVDAVGIRPVVTNSLERVPNHSAMPQSRALIPGMARPAHFSRQRPAVFKPRLSSPSLTVPILVESSSVNVEGVNRRLAEIFDRTERRRPGIESVAAVSAGTGNPAGAQASGVSALPRSTSRFSSSLRRLVSGVALLGTLVGGTLSALPSPASAENKVQYERYRFQILNLKDEKGNIIGHFDVYYHQGEEEAAREALRLAEKAYSIYRSVLNFDFKNRLPIIIYSSRRGFEQTNTTLDSDMGGTRAFTEFFKHRNVLYFTGDRREFAHVLVHEMGHQFQMQMDVHGSYKEGGWRMYMLPMWVVEGMAEYLAIREIDVHTAMYLRDAVIDGRIPSPLDMNTPGTGEYRFYRFGQALWHYIAREFGDEKVGEIFLKAMKYTHIENKGYEDMPVMIPGVDRALREAIGLNFQQLWERWSRDMRREYYPDYVEHKQGEPEEVGRMITLARKDGSLVNFSPALSPDGQKVAYISVRSNFAFSIYVASAKSGVVLSKLLDSGYSERFQDLRIQNASLEWSPDGKRIAFVSDSNGRSTLYVMEVANKKVVHKHIFDVDMVENPTWSPDGKQIAFSGLKGGRTNLYIAQVDSGRVRQLTNDAYHDTQPAWSPDGKRIAFSTDRGPDTDLENLEFGELKLALYDLQANRISVLPDQEGKSINPQWSPDGEWLAFVSDRTGISNLHAVHLESGEARQLTDVLTAVGGLGDRSPGFSWARFADRAVISIYRHGTTNVVTLDDPLSAERRGVVSVSLPAGGSSGDSVVSTPAESSPKETTESGMVGPIQPEGVYLIVPPQNQMAYTDSVHRPLPQDTLQADVLSDSLRFVSSRYKARFSPDVVGYYDAAVFSISDMLGEHNFSLIATPSGLRGGRFFSSYTNRVNRLNWGVNAFQLNSYRFNRFEGPWAAYRYSWQTYQGIQGRLKYPFSHFRRVQADVDFVRTTGFPEVGVDSAGRVFSAKPPHHSYFVSPGLAYVENNLTAGPPYGYPVRGTLIVLEARQALGDRQFSEFTAEARQYKSLGWNTSVALRAALGTFQGRDRLVYRIGGPYSIRGYRQGSVIGNTIGFANAELRFPLPIPMMVQGVLFSDVGYASSPSGIKVDLDTRYPSYFNTDRTVGSYGGEVRFVFGLIWGITRYRTFDGETGWQFSIFPGY